MLYIIITLFIILDIISGVTKALYEKDLNSKTMREGLIHKFSYVLILALAYLIDYSSEYMALPFDPNLFQLTTVMVCITEAISIIENVLTIAPANFATKIRDIFRSEQYANDEWD